MVTSRNLERDDDLALFHEMHKRERERKSKPLLISASGNAEPLLASRLGSSSLCKVAAPSQPPTSTYKREDLLTSDAGKNDYDWLLTPPGTPLIAATEHDPTSMDFKGLPNLVRSLAAIKTSRGLPMNAKSEAISKALRPDSSKLGRSNLYSSASAPSRRVSSLAPCSTPTSRPASRPTTPTRGPVSGSGARNSHAPASNTRSVSGHSSRSTTPSRRPLTQSQPAHSSQQPTSSRPSPALKASSGLPTRSTPSSRGSSPTTRPRAAAWQPSAMPGFSLEPPPNLRTTIPARSLSNSRGASIGPSRPSQASAPSVPTAGAAAPTSASLARAASSHSDAALAADRPRRQSCSPSVARGRSTPERPSHAPSSGNAKPDSSPVVKGHKMVEKLMQSRRAAAAASSLQDTPVLQLKRAVKPTTPTKKDAESFGRNLSRRSMDMALRHMDLRQSASNGLRSLAPSSMYPPAFYSVRSVGGRGRAAGYSPMTTSSTASSEHSVSLVRDPEGGSEMGEEASSEVGSKASPMSLTDSVYSLTKDARASSWIISSPDYRDDSVELMKLFRQGIEKLSGSESPLVCQHGGGSSTCDLCSVKNRLHSLSHNMRASIQQRSEDVSKGSSPFSSSSLDLSSPSQC